MDISHYKPEPHSSCYIATRVAFRDQSWEIHIAWKNMNNGFYLILQCSHTSHFKAHWSLRKIKCHENHVRCIYLTTVPTKVEVGSKREIMWPLFHHMLTSLTLERWYRSVYQQLTDMVKIKLYLLYFSLLIGFHNYLRFYVFLYHGQFIAIELVCDFYFMR